MKVLVTGATGFLGYHIAKDLLAKGHEVINFSRRHTEELEEIGLTTRIGSLLNTRDIELALNEVDAVIHTAGFVGMWGTFKDFYDTNVIGTQNLVSMMKKHSINYLVYTSTPSVVFGQESIINGDESIPYPKKHLNAYAQTKSIAEKFILESSDEFFKTTAIRPHLIYGKRDKNIIPRLVERAKQGRLKRIGDGTNMVDINYVENASIAHVRALEELCGQAKNNAKAYFIGQERPVNLWQFINQILEIKGQTKVTKAISISSAYTIGALLEFFFTIFRIKSSQPPMTRFVALQLGTSHYFGHDAALRDFNHSADITIEESLTKI